MHLDIEIYQQIDLYLEGKLSGKELIDFENELLINDFLKNKIEVVKLTNDLILDFKLDELKSRMSNDLKNIPFENKEKAKNSWIYFAILGMLTFASLGYYFYNQSNTEIISSTITEKVQEQNPEIVNDKKTALIPPKIDNTKKDVIANKNESKNTIIVNLPIETNAVDNQTNHIDINPINLNQHIAIEPQNQVIVNATTQKQAIENANPCNHEKVKATILSEASCIDVATGMIKIDQLKNGTSPYYISIDKGLSFNNDLQFNNLQSGKYSVLIKDKFGCLSNEYNIEIETKNCTKVINEFAFSPGLNEVFKFPIESGAEGKIQILTRNGQIVFTANISEIQEWNGESNTGFGIEAGVYVFVIEFKNGKLQKGYITLY